MKLKKTWWTLLFRIIIIIIHSNNHFSSFIISVVQFQQYNKKNESSTKAVQKRIVVLFLCSLRSIITHNFFVLLLLSLREERKNDAVFARASLFHACTNIPRDTSSARLKKRPWGNENFWYTILKIFYRTVVLWPTKELCNGISLRMSDQKTLEIFMRYTIFVATSIHLYFRTAVDTRQLKIRSFWM